MRKFNAFTMVEMLLYMALLGGILLVITNILITSLEVKADAVSTSSLDQDSRFIVTRFNYDIKRASSITTPINAGDTSNSLVLVINGDSVTYDVSSGNLQLTDSTGSYRLNSDQTTISNLNFERLGTLEDSTITVNYVITAVTGSNQGLQFKNVTTTIGLR